MKTNRKGRHAVGTMLLTACVLIVNGCEVRKHVTNMPAQETERLVQCQKEVDALKDLHPEQHAAYKKAFDSYMSGAAQYAGLRTQVNSETRETVDALYRYKVNRLCADIGVATLNALAERGESLK
ncbi:hypothetical protein [Serratia liquefaciens]|uniref:hypothetical protein n=1 Tax=Serratia liquefaciens TaxID=614 RepID=UPI0023621A1C|nr:hypothetical protein [Serratia liquefaciens]